MKALTVQTILVVDDDPHIREVVCYALGKSGYRATSASNGQQAIGRFNEGQVDLVVLDIMMPEMDGFEFVSHLQADSANRSIPIVVVTAKDTTAEERKALKGHVQAVLQKGEYSRDGLLERIRALVSDQIPADPGSDK